MDYIVIETPTEDRVYQVVDIQQPGPLAPVIVTVQYRRRKVLLRRERAARAVERARRKARRRA